MNPRRRVQLEVVLDHSNEDNLPMIQTCARKQKTSVSGKIIKDEKFTGGGVRTQSNANLTTDVPNYPDVRLKPLTVALKRIDVQATIEEERLRCHVNKKEADSKTDLLPLPIRADLAKFDWKFRKWDDDLKNDGRQPATTNEKSPVHGRQRKTVGLNCDDGMCSPGKGAIISAGELADSLLTKNVVKGSDCANLPFVGPSEMPFVGPSDLPPKRKTISIEFTEGPDSSRLATHSSLTSVSGWTSMSAPPDDFSLRLTANDCDSYIHNSPFSDVEIIAGNIATGVDTFDITDDAEEYFSCCGDDSEYFSCFSSFSVESEEVDHREKEGEEEEDDDLGYNTCVTVDRVESRECSRDKHLSDSNCEVAFIQSSYRSYPDVESRRISALKHHSDLFEYALPVQPITIQLPKKMLKKGKRKFVLYS